MFTLRDRTELNKSAVFKAVFAVISMPLVVSAASAASHAIKPPPDSSIYSWPFLAFLGLVILGAVAAIIWEMLSDTDAS